MAKTTPICGSSCALTIARAALKDTLSEVEALEQRGVAYVAGVARIVRTALAEMEGAGA